MSHEFGLQLLKNETVKQHKNDHSGTWGDLEQEFTEIFYFILMIFLNIYPNTKCLRPKHA